jgi:hypothetical protein
VQKKAREAKCFAGFLSSTSTAPPPASEPLQIEPRKGNLRPGTPGFFLQTKATATNDPGSAQKMPTRPTALRPGTPTPRGMEKLEWKGRIVLSVLRKD